MSTSRSPRYSILSVVALHRAPRRCSIIAVRALIGASGFLAELGTDLGLMRYREVRRESETHR